nr:PREDICTED: xenotropic and polytropic retrovirus receptor 1 homolog [Bemisia tabaci]XP_018899351.1 PREDICTED: xenotropic and polytropic retrovirus receptor 1 homolog [Bemisia tabaci]
MKFAEHLSAHITPEWRKQYINYDEMKLMLSKVIEEAPSPESVEPEIITRHFSQFDENFFLYCDKELQKINVFYAEKLAEATRKYASLCVELKAALELGKKKHVTSGAGNDIPPRKLQELKLAFSEYYLSLILLQSYQTLNYVGFRKILKKHDKLLRVDTGSKWWKLCMETAHFHTNNEISRLITETENTVTQELEGGNRQKAMKRLRVPPLGEQQSPWITFKVGLFSGSFLVLFCAVILSALYHQSSYQGLATVFRLYRAPLLLIMFLFLIGVNVYGWRSSGVNHVLIFELDPRNHLTEQHLMELATIFGVIWALSILCFLYSNSLSIPQYLNPIILVFVMAFFFLNPLRTFQSGARFWCIKVLWRMFLAPFYHVGFADFWLADQLNSLATVLLDFHFLVCFYFTSTDWMSSADIHPSFDNYWLSRAIVNCVPAWIRFAQCLRRYYDSGEAFPHIANAMKYASTFFVVIFQTLLARTSGSYSDITLNPFFYCWVCACIVNSLYAYIWDVKMDWGLFDLSSAEYQLLREETVYSSSAFYYFAIIEDFILRFTWLYSFWLTNHGYVSAEMMTTITAPLEVFRRFVWNFFRLENEHLNNCGKFRAVRDISIAPIDSSDQTQIVRMMDDDCFVTNRKVRKPNTKKSTKEDKRPLLTVDDNLSEAASFQTL